MLPSLLRLLFVLALAYGAWQLLLRLRVQLDERRAALRDGRPRGGRSRVDDPPFDLIEGGEGETRSGGRVIPLRDDPHALLGVPSDASDEDVEAAYRRLIEQNSPDKVAGLSEEIRETAARMTRRIEQAWEEVRRIRGQ